MIPPTATVPATARSGRSDPWRHPPVAGLSSFFLLSFLLAWAFWIGAAAFTASASFSPAMRSVFFIPGTFGPGIIAVCLTARAAGRSATRTLLNRLFDWQHDLRWYVFAAGYMAAMKLIAAVLNRVLAGAWPAFGAEPFYLLLPAIALSTPFQAGEEIGWRGYALPGLVFRMGFAWASVLLGIIWALWHMPLFFLTGTDTTSQSFPVYLLSVTALSVAMTWLFLHTSGSLLPVSVMHAAINNTKDLVPSASANATNALGLAASPVAWITAILLWIAAIYFLVRMSRTKTGPFIRNSKNWRSDQNRTSAP